MQTLLSIVIGNLGALLVHGLSWQMRKKCLWLLMILGALCIPAFFAATVFVYTAWVNRDYHIDGEADETVTEWWTVFGTTSVAFLLTGVCSIIHMRQILSRWWSAFLAIWGEMLVGLGFLILVGLFCYPSSYIHSWISRESCFCSFAGSLLLLAVLRPLCVRWIHPVWRLMLNLGKPTVGNQS